jgi:hypothetical protein
MRWFKHGFASSLHGFFAQNGLTVRSQTMDCTDEIRQTMLSMLGDRIDSRESALLVRRLRLAMDAQELWFAREGLMANLAQQHGESAAREKLARLDALFEGQVPAALHQSAGRARTLN